MMTSILGLQEDTAKTQEMQTFIEQNRLRIKSIALVHELLYKEENFKSINLHNYIQSLITHILSISKNNQIDIHLNIEDIALCTDDIIHIGIILNELVTNSFKYAFEDHTGKIDIKLQRQDNDYTLHYSDNGKGMKHNELAHDGFGFRLIKLSIQHLNGSIQIDANKGFHTLILFKGTEL